MRLPAGWSNMSMGILAAFVAACIFLAITPGPNMSLIIANTTAHGLGGGLWTLAGSTTGLAILVGIAALGMTSVMVLMADWFDVIRWLGAAYLIYLGARQLRAALRAPSSLVARPPNSGSLYLNGLLVSLSNPKVLLFLGAFLPQFVDTSRPAFAQIMTLGLIVMAVATVTDSIYAVLAGRARDLFTTARVRMMSRVSGVVLMIGGVWLALVRKG